MSKLLNDWASWKEACSVAATPADQRQRLSEFVNAVGWRYIRKWAIQQGQVERNLPVVCFDTTTWVKETIQGKAWKDHMIAISRQQQNAGNEVSVIRKYTAGVIRAAIRKYLAETQNFFPAVRRVKTVSGDTPMGRAAFEGPGKTLLDFLAKNDEKNLGYLDLRPISREDHKVYLEIAAQETPLLLERLSDSDKGVLACLAYGLPKSNEVLLKHLGVKKSQASAKIKKLSQKIEDNLRENFPEEDEDCFFYLCKQVILRMSGLIVENFTSLPPDIQSELAQLEEQREKKASKQVIK